jgi:hypothetical protein
MISLHEYVEMLGNILKRLIFCISSFGCCLFILFALEVFIINV